MKKISLFLLLLIVVALSSCKKDTEHAIVFETMDTIQGTETWNLIRSHLVQ